MKPRSVAALSFWLAIASIALHVAMAPAQAIATGRVPTVSRLVMQFTEQEKKLADRIRAGDAAGAGSALTDDFELRAASKPGRPVPRADWLHQSLQSPGPEATPTQMAVHDLGESAVVSFLQPADTANSSLFVVDVWRRVGVEWKLAIRYVSPASAGRTPIPGAPASEPEIPKKY